MFLDRKAIETDAPLAAGRAEQIYLESSPAPNDDWGKLAARRLQSLGLLRSLRGSAVSGAR